MITHEEARKELLSIDIDLHDIAEDYIANYNISLLQRYITQQEQFAKDVARYFELEQQFYDGFSDDVDVETLDEMNKESEALKEKLSKVGKEE